MRQYQCPIHDNSLNFSRTVCGLLALFAFLIRSPWLVLIAGILMFPGVISEKYNLLYRFHFLILRKLLKDKSEPVKRESGELTFACGMSGSFLLVSFLLLYFEKFTTFAWLSVLIISILLLLAGIAGFCVAAIMYAFFKKIFRR